MEGVCFHSNRKDLQTNEEFCNSILQYLHLESERYLKKEHKALSDCKIDNSVTKMKEEKVVDLYNVFSRASNNWKNSDGKLRRTCSYPTISEGETLNTVVETSPESSEELLYFRRPGEGFEDDLEEDDSNEDIEENSSESCDNKKPQNAEKSDSQEKAKPVIGDDPNKRCGTWNKIDQSSLKVDGFRRKWSREKSQSSRELCQQKERNPGANSKIKLETVAQVVEARPRSHHFLWTIPDPGSQKLNWHKPPLTVLVVKKIYDESVLEPFKGLISWLIETRKMIVYVESNVLKEDILEEDSIFKKYRDRLQTFKDAKDDLTDKIDFIICLGGDGTLLHASSLFQQSCPPVMAFHQGSLGFLTPFSFDNFETQVTSVLEGNASLLLRYRLKCVICKEDSELGRVTRIKHIDRSSPCGNSQILVLNEVVVDRGSSSYICNIDLYVEGRHVTSVQGDGLIISTPTGSTAYAVAAGASMIHPNVPAIMITPICPHSLSFRPIVVPAGVELKIMLSPEARGGAMVSFDGRNRQEIFQGDSVRITTAQFPLPAVCAKDQIDDWFDRLAECLHWNVRKPQKMLSVSSTNSEHSTNSMTNSQNNSTDSIEDGAT